MTEKVSVQMQRVLRKLGVPLQVVWTPEPKHKRHGLIEKSSRTMFIFDDKEEEAWITFTHELVEWKLKSTLDVYREIINSLIEALEKVAYQRKEEFLSSLPELFGAVEEARTAKHNQERV